MKHPSTEQRAPVDTAVQLPKSIEDFMKKWFPEANIMTLDGDSRSINQRLIELWNKELHTQHTECEQKVAEAVKAERERIIENLINMLDSRAKSLKDIPEQSFVIGLRYGNDIGLNPTIEFYSDEELLKALTNTEGEA